MLSIGAPLGRLDAATHTRILYAIAGLGVSARLRLDRRIRGGDASVDVSLEIGDEASHGVAATAAEKMEAKCVRTDFQSNTAPDVQVDGVDFDVFISVVVDDSPQAEGRPGR